MMMSFYNTGTPSGSFGDARRRRRSRKSDAGRVSPSRAAAPAQASVLLWAPNAQHPTSSKTSTHALSQRYCARGPRARLSTALGGLWGWRWRVPMFPAYLQISPYFQIYRSVSPDLQICILTNISFYDDRPFIVLTETKPLMSGGPGGMCGARH